MIEIPGIISILNEVKFDGLGYATNLEIYSRKKDEWERHRVSLPQILIDIARKYKLKIAKDLQYEPYERTYKWMFGTKLKNKVTNKVLVIKFIGEDRVIDYDYREFSLGDLFATFTYENGDPFGQEVEE